MFLTRVLEAGHSEPGPQGWYRGFLELELQATLLGRGFAERSCGKTATAKRESDLKLWSGVKPAA